jgi:hypothetical protein
VVENEGEALGVIEASVLPFLALWLASVCALHGRGMNHAARVLTGVMIAIPALLTYEVLLGFIAQATSR